jgi:hypothetical protein
MIEVAKLLCALRIPLTFVAVAAQGNPERNSCIFALYPPCKESVEKFASCDSGRQDPESGLDIASKPARANYLHIVK